MKLIKEKTLKDSSLKAVSCNECKQHHSVCVEIAEVWICRDCLAQAIKLLPVDRGRAVMRDRLGRAIRYNECSIGEGDEMIEISAGAGMVIVSAGDRDLTLREINRDWPNGRFYQLQIKENQ